MNYLHKIVTQFGRYIALKSLWKMKLFALITTVFSVLLLSWVLPKLVAPKNCISSSLVERITFEDSKKNINRCDVRSRLFSKGVDSWVEKSLLINRIDSLERINYLLPKPMQTLQIYISERSNEDLSLEENVLIIGRRQIERPTVLERALLTYWFSHPDPMVAQVLADFSWAYLRGKLKASSHAEAWLMSYHGLSEYCQKGSNLFVHEEYCSVQRELGDALIDSEEQVHPMVWSLYPIYTKILARVFLNSSYEMKEQILERLVFMNKFSDLSEYLATAVYPDLEEYDQAFIDSVYFSFAPLGISKKHLENAIEPFLMRNSESWTYLVLAEDVSVSDPTALPASIIEDESAQKHFVPSGVSASLSRHNIFKYLQVKEVVYVGCAPPEIERLLDFEAYVKKMIFVRLCGDKIKDLKNLLFLGSKHFLRSHPEWEFIEFNLKALRVTSEVKILPQQGFKKFSELYDWLETQGAKYDSRRGAFRPLSPYEGVAWFRLESL